MLKLKPFKIYFLFTVLLLISSLIYAILIKKEMVETNESSITKTTFIIGLIMFFILGFMAGNNKQKNGIVIGFVYGLIVILILFLVHFLGFDNLEKNYYIKAALYLLSSSIGGMIGVNIKKII